MDRNRKNRDNSYYASSRRDMHSIGNGRSYRGPYDNDNYQNNDDLSTEQAGSYQNANYDDGYDDNYPSPAYSMGSGNFNMGRKVNRDTGNMFKPDYDDWDDDSFRDDPDSYREEKGYDRNYSDDFHEPDDGEDMYGQPIGRYNRNYFDTRNRENKVVRHRRRTDNKTASTGLQRSKTGKKGLSYTEREGNDGTDWYGYYNRAYYGANNSNYDDRPENHSSKRNYAGTLRRKRPYL